MRSFVASNLVFMGEALAGLAPGLSDTPGIVIVSLLGAIAAIYGYALIHAYTRWMSVVSGLVLLLAFVWIIGVHGLPADFLAKNSFNWTGFLDAISVAALWQIAYAPYVSDYTRYMPVDTGVKPAFWASYWGCVLGSFLPMILGVVGGAARRRQLSCRRTYAVAGRTGAARTHRILGGYRRCDRDEPVLRRPVLTDVRPDIPAAAGRRARVREP